MTEPEEVFNLAEAVEQFSREFDVRCAERHDAGAAKYGPGKFLSVDTVDEALQEAADLANYTRYTYIRLCLLREWIVQFAPPDDGDDEMHISRGFVKAKDATEPRKANT